MSSGSEGPACPPEAPSSLALSRNQLAPHKGSLAQLKSRPSQLGATAPVRRVPPVAAPPLPPTGSQAAIEDLSFTTASADGDDDFTAFLATAPSRARSSTVAFESQTPASSSSANGAGRGRGSHLGPMHPHSNAFSPGGNGVDGDSPDGARGHGPGLARSPPAALTLPMSQGGPTSPASSHSSLSPRSPGSPLSPRSPRASVLPGNAPACSNPFATLTRDAAARMAHARQRRPASAAAPAPGIGLRPGPAFVPTHTNQQQYQSFEKQPLTQSSAHSTPVVPASPTRAAPRVKDIPSPTNVSADSNASSSASAAAPVPRAPRSPLHQPRLPLPASPAPEDTPPTSACGPHDGPLAGHTAAESSSEPWKRQAEDKQDVLSPLLCLTTSSGGASLSIGQLPGDNGAHADDNDDEGDSAPSASPSALASGSGHGSAFHSGPASASHTPAISRTNTTTSAGASCSKGVGYQQLSLRALLRALSADSSTAARAVFAASARASSLRLRALRAAQSNFAAERRVAELDARIQLLVHNAARSRDSRKHGDGHGDGAMGGHSPPASPAAAAAAAENAIAEARQAVPPEADVLGIVMPQAAALIAHGLPSSGGTACAPDSSSSSSPSSVVAGGLFKLSRSQRGAIEALVFVLQRRPGLLAALAHATGRAAADWVVARGRVEGLVQFVVLEAMGDPADGALEQALLDLFAASLTHQAMECGDAGSFLRGNTPLSSMLTTYARRGAGLAAVRAVLGPSVRWLAEATVDDAAMLTHLPVPSVPGADTAARACQPVSLRLQPAEIVAEWPAQVVPPGSLAVPAAERAIAAFGAARAKLTSTPSTDTSLGGTLGEPMPLAAAELTALEQTPLLKAERDFRVSALLAAADRLLEGLYASTDALPHGLRWVCRRISETARARFPSLAPGEELTFVGGFLILRVVNPALVAPHTFELLPSAPQRTARSSLVLLAGLIQRIANGHPYKQSETHMLDCNPFIQAHIPRMRAFFARVIDVPPLAALLLRRNAPAAAALASASAVASVAASSASGASGSPTSAAVAAAAAAVASQTAEAIAAARLLRTQQPVLTSLGHVYNVLLLLRSLLPEVIALVRVDAETEREAATAAILAQRALGVSRRRSSVVPHAPPVVPSLPTPAAGTDVASEAVAATPARSVHGGMSSDAVRRVARARAQGVDPRLLRRVSLLAQTPASPLALRGSALRAARRQRAAEERKIPRRDGAPLVADFSDDEDDAGLGDAGSSSEEFVDSDDDDDDDAVGLSTNANQGATSTGARPSASASAGGTVSARAAAAEAAAAAHAKEEAAWEAEFAEPDCSAGSLAAPAEALAGTGGMGLSRTGLPELRRCLAVFFPGFTALPPPEERALLQHPLVLRPRDPATVHVAAAAEKTATAAATDEKGVLMLSSLAQALPNARLLKGKGKDSGSGTGAGPGTNTGKTGEPSSHAVSSSASGGKGGARTAALTTSPTTSPQSPDGLRRLDLRNGSSSDVAAAAEGADAAAASTAAAIAGGGGEISDLNVYARLLAVLPLLPPLDSFAAPSLRRAADKAVPPSPGEPADGWVARVPASALVRMLRASVGWVRVHRDPAWEPPTWAVTADAAAAAAVARTTVGGAVAAAGQNNDPAAAAAAAEAAAEAELGLSARPSVQVQSLIQLLEVLSRTAPEHTELVTASELAGWEGPAATRVRSALEAPTAVLRCAPGSCARVDRHCARWCALWLSELPARNDLLLEARHRSAHLEAVLAVVEAHGRRLAGRIEAYEAYVAACKQGGTRATALPAAPDRGRSASANVGAGGRVRGGTNVVPAAPPGGFSVRHGAGAGSVGVHGDALAAASIEGSLRWRTYSPMILSNKGVLARVNPAIRPAELRAVVFTIAEVERGVYRLSARGPAAAAGRVLPVAVEVDVEQLLAIERDCAAAEEEGTSLGPGARCLILDHTLAVDAIALLNRVIRKHFT